ncbi:MAG: OmpA family protein [Thermodesulfobacteriota bacterium]|nr:OmpA family protein [Thermodesulfobacteriota bacterium]
MKRNRFKSILIVFVVFLFAGCAGQQVRTDMSQFTPVSLEQESDNLKVDNFLVILDTSASMNERHNGVSKFDQEKEAVRRMNQTIACLDVKGALRAFGQGKDTTLLYGLTDYAASGFKEGLDKATHADGNSPLDAAIDGAGNDLQSASGTVALIIFSDAKKLDEALVIASARKIKKAFGDRICIYTVLIGDDEAGEKLMREISGTGSCGFATNADSIFGAQDMADFSRKVFFGGSTSLASTTSLVSPTIQASMVLDGVEFEFDRFFIRPDFYSILDESVKILKDNPSVNVRFEGHTDNIGSEAYNQKLSENRARAVMNYFIEKGISADRLSTVGFGYTKPIADNGTSAGRARNRRAELITIK